MSKVYTLKASLYYIEQLIRKGEKIGEIKIYDDDIIDIITDKGEYIVRDSGDGASLRLQKIDKQKH